MAELILHHYEMSPYARKIRLALGLKGARWRSVEAPLVMPKPDLVELTGGYRRVPVLQIGADVYCDTHCIAPVLDARLPGPRLYPSGRETEAHALSKWAESTFMLGVLAFFGIGGVFPEAFVEDRRKTMVPPDQDLDRAGMLLPTKLLQIRANLERLEAMLADGRPFLQGETASIADLSAFHPASFLALHETTAALADGLPQLAAWMPRVAAIGEGDAEPMGSGEAIEVARAAEPAAPAGAPTLPAGMPLGTPVVVLPDEYGSGNVAGTLAASSLHEIAVRRRSERAGDVVVHFPRQEYTVIATG